VIENKEVLQTEREMLKKKKGEKKEKLRAA
jgi:hypothetical protein